MNAWASMSKAQQLQQADRLIRLGATDEEVDGLDLRDATPLTEQLLKLRGELR